MKRIGEATQAQINIWKKQHKNIHEIVIDDDDVERVCYVKSPDLDILAAASKYATENPVKSGLIMFNSVWIGGDEAIQQDDELKMSAIQKIGDIFRIREAKIKKL